MLITPSILKDEKLKPDNQKVPQLYININYPKFEIHAVNIDGILKGKSDFEVDSLNYLIFENIPSSKLARNPTLKDWNDCLWYTEKAYLSIKYKDWEALGKNLDLAYAAERNLMELTKMYKVIDVAYAMARSAGAWGGYPSENKLFVVCPEDKKDIIKTTVEDAIRNISA